MTKITYDCYLLSKEITFVNSLVHCFWAYLLINYKNHV